MVLFFLFILLFFILKESLYVFVFFSLSFFKVILTEPLLLFSAVKLRHHWR